MEEKKISTKKTVATKTTAKPSTKTEKKVVDKATTKNTEKVTKESSATEEKIVNVEKKNTQKVEKSKKYVEITLNRSTIGCLEKQKRTIEAMGLRKIRSQVTMPDNACTRGMIYVVKHLVSVKEVK